jgi:acetyl esterase/lipase
MKNFPAVIYSAVLAALPFPALAQQGYVSRTDPVVEPGALLLPAAPGASSAGEVWDLFGPGNPVVRNVTQPTLTPVLPDPAKATGAAVIVAPGGGFFMLSMTTEGFAVAHQLAARGIAAFVLKYRLDPTPVAEAEFLPAIMKRFQQAPKDPSTVTKMERPEATADALAAARLIRQNAGQWHIDPARVGIIGFSAGAMTAMSFAQSAPAGEGPAFVGYIYGPQAMDTAADDAPPLFDALAVDDPLFGTTSFPVVAAWRAHKRPVELHVYGSGGHGFGFGKPGQTNSMLVEEFSAWLSMQGFLAGKNGK